MVFGFHTYVGRKGSVTGLRKVMGCREVLTKAPSHSVGNSGVGMALQSDE